MHRVELKAIFSSYCLSVILLFLMYRVELKESIVPGLFRTVTLVPNVPCGVERMILVNFANVPCEFLMYRVELKAFLLILQILPIYLVPNVPCGVES